MLIRPGASGGAMWLYTHAVERLAKLDCPTSLGDVDSVLNNLCPEGWGFHEVAGQWGLWPHDPDKATTHCLVYSELAPKMKEVSNAIHA